MGLITEWRWQSATEVKNISLEVFCSELQNEKKWGKKLTVLSICGNAAGHLNPGSRGKSAVQKKTFEETMNKNFPNLIKDIKLQIQEAQVIAP